MHTPTTPSRCFPFVALLVAASLTGCGAAVADASTPEGSASSLPMAPGAAAPSAGGHLADGSGCELPGAATCTAPACDDGSAAAARLVSRGLTCAFIAGADDWSKAMRTCEALGEGSRLATKAEAMRIAQTPTLCNYMTPPNGWLTWTSTCAADGKAWRVFGQRVLIDDSFGSGEAEQEDVGNELSGYALCIR